MGPNEIAIIRVAAERGLLKPGFTVMELGQQDVRPGASAEAIRVAFGWQDALSVWHASAIYSRLGSPRYESISLDGGVNAHAFDIERDLSQTYGFDTGFDLVTNFGVSARCFDQDAVFANVHALTVAGGVMLHVLPSAAEPGALLSYSAAFFHALAAANDYHLEAVFLATEGSLRPGAVEATDAAVCAIMVKRSDQPFVAPTVAALPEGLRASPTAPAVVQSAEPSPAAPPAEVADPLPSVIIVSIPKSGTVYMNRLFCNGLGLANTIVSNRYFPEDQLSLDAMPHFAAGGCYASVHIEPSAPNLQLLKAFVPRWVVHFRDPRSVTLSWVHHVARLAGEGRSFELHRVCPVPPPALHDWSFERRVDWHLEHFLPAVIRWMNDWLDVAERLPDRIRVTEFAVLKEDERSLVASILDFLGIDEQHYAHMPQDKTMDVHYRVGDYDEWRRAFTPQQVADASAMITPRLLERFGWPAG